MRELGPDAHRARYEAVVWRAEKVEDAAAGRVRVGRHCEHTAKFVQHAEAENERDAHVAVVRDGPVLAALDAPRRADLRALMAVRARTEWRSAHAVQLEDPLAYEAGHEDVAVHAFQVVERKAERLVTGRAPLARGDRHQRVMLAGVAPEEGCENDEPQTEDHSQRKVGRGHGNAGDRVRRDKREARDRER